MGTDVGAATTILILALVTYATRIGGVVLMSRLTLSPRIERGLEALAGSVLVAIVVPAAVAGDWAAKLAVAVAIATVLLSGSNFAAIACGLVAAAALRALL